MEVDGNTVDVGQVMTAEVAQAVAAFKVFDDAVPARDGAIVHADTIPFGPTDGEFSIGLDKENTAGQRTSDGRQTRWGWRSTFDTVNDIGEPGSGRRLGKL